MKIVLLSGSELRHRYFVTKFMQESEFDVVGVFQEGIEKSLFTRAVKEGSQQLINHAKLREISEKDSFLKDLSVQTKESLILNNILKGEINDAYYVQKILDLEPDLLVCYGSSLIKGELINRFKGRFLNVHLGLSPYYLGSGTNIWPLVNLEPEFLGATFMHIDEGIDTGEVIHQIQGDLEITDTPHSAGNRLIKRMVNTYLSLTKNFNSIIPMEQIEYSTSKYYVRRDFTPEVCRKLYYNFDSRKIFEVRRNNQVSIIKNPILKTTVL